MSVASGLFRSTNRRPSSCLKILKSVAPCTLTNAASVSPMAAATFFLLSMLGITDAPLYCRGIRSRGGLARSDRRRIDAMLAMTSAVHVLCQART